MTSLAAFCARAGIGEEAARQALNTRAAHDDAPWYMQAVLGIGAWITAIAALFFVGAVMDLVFDIREPNFAVAVVGTIVFGAGVWLLHHRPEGAFTAHAAVAFATAGTLLASAGIGISEDSVWAAAVTTLPFAAAAIWQRRSLLLQFLIVSVALILAIATVWDHWEHLIADLPAIFTPFGVALLLYPPRFDVRPTAFALLIVPQLVELAISDFETGWMLWYGWPAKLLFLAVFAFLFAINWRRVADSQGRLLAAAGAAATAAVTLLLPTGASAALVLLTLAYTIGSRSLAAIGALAEVYFIWRFYSDLQDTLLTKSIILMSAGAVLLICYGLLIGALRERRRS
ncbi:MAG TPA: DUF4401 domain-containing protein [Dongiaceae bacterium]|jgi:hypothetical protein|nr:DUF4401 domain-containing protein [Dongiaceae bacterium]